MRPIKRFLLCCLALACLSLGGLPARGQETAGATGEASLPDLHRLDQEIVAARRDETSQNAARLGVPLEDLREYSDNLAVLRNLVLRIQAERRWLGELETRRKVLSADQGPAFPEGAPPYPLSLLDGIRDRMENAQRRLDKDRFLKRSYAADREADLDELKNAQAEQRVLRERLDQAGLSRRERLRVAWKLEAALLDERLCRAALASLELRMKGIEAEQLLLTAGRDRDAQLLSALLPKVGYSAQDLEAQRHLVEEKLNLFARWARQNEEHQADLTGLLARRGGARGEKEDPEREALDLLLSLYQRLEDQARQAEQVLLQTRQVWERRYSLLKGGDEAPEVSMLHRWKEENDLWIAFLRETVTERQQVLASFQTQVESLSRSLPAEKGEGEGGVRSELLRGIAETREQTLETIARFLALQALSGRFSDEIASRETKVGWWRNAQAAVSLAAGVAWERELWVVEGRSVTLGKVVQALGILLAGIFLANLLSRIVRARIHANEKRDIHLALLLQRLVYYLFVAGLVLFALHVVHIPLTAFAFLGGAVAIGIGVGAQDFFRNLISGLILMVEKPVRIRDIIEIDGEYAVVKEIDSRTAHVRTFDGVDLFLPNSAFLGDKIRNRTYAHRTVKVKVDVTVAYGSDPGTVRRLMLEAAEVHPRVLADPEPYVRFAEFQNSALLFRLTVFLSQEELVRSGRILEDARSDLRFALAESLPAAGIDIVPGGLMDVRFPAGDPFPKGKDEVPR